MKLFLAAVAIAWFLMWMNQPVERTTVVNPVSTIEAAPAESPTSVPAAVSWHGVQKWEGSATKKTESFHITGDEWRLSWATRPGEIGAANFSISVYDVHTGQMAALAANVIGKNADTSVMRGAGDYYLDISTLQPYVIEVEDSQ